MKKINQKFRPYVLSAFIMIFLLSATVVQADTGIIITKSTAISSQFTSKGQFGSSCVTGFQPGFSIRNLHAGVITILSADMVAEFNGVTCDADDMTIPFEPIPTDEERTVNYIYNEACWLPEYSVDVRWHGSVTYSFNGEIISVDYDFTDHFTFCNTDDTEVDDRTNEQDNSGEMNTVEIFPNPFNDVVNVSLELPQAESINVKVFDAVGRQVYNYFDPSFSGGVGTKSLNLSELSSGVYFVLVFDEQKLIDKSRIVKK